MPVSSTSDSGSDTSTLPMALNWIDGEWTDSGEHADSVDPATGAVIGRYARGTADDARRAIEAAHRAFAETPWKHDRALRGRVLNAMADRFAARIDDLVDLLALENGKVKPHGRLEVGSVPQTLRFNAALALTDSGRASQVQQDSLGLVVREPVGVAGIIAPWNSPVALTIRSLAPALAAGVTTVVSLPTQTAQINAMIAEIIAGTPELPRGVVNVVTGGRATGGALVDSPLVPTISFTGSTATGKAITASSAAHLKRLGLELGGKTPLIVFDDADLEATLPLVVSALTVFAGQFCMTGSRLLVQAGIADTVRAELVARLAGVKVGPAADPDSEMGPVIDKNNVERIDAIVEDAIASGAKPLLRGGPVRTGPLAAGAFFRPALLEVTDPKLRVVQEEVFGPVLTMQTFETEAEAVALANDSQYGLSAAVFSRDADRPLRVALRLESGTVWINDWATLFDQYEEGGYKNSGQGRMRGLAVLDDFVEYKHIQLRPGTLSQGDHRQ
jgi:betaine-aldehyde dehydrogenase